MNPVNRSESVNLGALFEAAAMEFGAAFKRSEHAARPDEIGGGREQHLRRFLVEWLPVRYGVTNGYIINRRHFISRQCDVIFFDSSTCPKFIVDIDKDLRLVPFGDVFGTIEVKSSLTKHELDDAIEKTKSVNVLNPDSSWFDPSPFQTEEMEVEAAEIREKDILIPRYSPEQKWKRFVVRRETKDEYTPPFSMVFAYRFGKDLNLTKAKSYLETLEYGPDAVVVLNSGLLVRSGRDAMQRLKSLTEGRPAEAYRFDKDVRKAERTREVYITKSSRASKVNHVMFRGQHSGYLSPKSRFRFSGSISG